MGKQKAFTSLIAINIPDPSRAEIAAFQEKLQSKNSPFVWEMPDTLHIPLHFLGKTNDSTLHEIKTALIELLQNQKPFEIKPTYVDYFYKRHGDSVLFLVLRDKAEIKKLEKDIREVLETLGFSPPQKFQPHIPIAHLPRLRHPNQVKQILYEITEKEKPDFSPFQVGQLEIMKSVLHTNSNTTEFSSRIIVKFGIS